MSHKYKVRNNDKPYFVTFATVYWIDVFTRNAYRDEFLDSLRFCQQRKGLEVYAWCLMPSHAHLILGTHQKPIHEIIRDFKAFTSRRLRELINDHPQESRKEWMVWLIGRAGMHNGNNNEWQLWQPGYHPVELENWSMCKQKMDYIHYNPVEAGFVDEPAGWLYSSARDYSGGKGLLEVEVLEG